MEEFPDLHILLQNDPVAQEYFDELQSYVRNQIEPRSEDVNPLENSMNDSEVFTRGEY